MRRVGIRSAFTVSAAVTLLAAAGCSLLPGLLRMSPVEVLAHDPDRELVDPESVRELSVRFSGVMNRTATEQAFSLQEGSEAREGRFAWKEGDRLLGFTPLVPLAAGRLYTLSVSAAAEDVDGNSLAEPLRFQFRTGADDRRPAVVRLFPADGAVVESPREPIVVEFSEAVDPANLYAGFSLFPAVPGSFGWSAGGREVVFQPVADYTPGTRYELTLQASITDRSGNTLAEDVHSWFTAAAVEEPAVAEVATVPGGGVLEAVSAGVALNRDLGIEKDGGLRVSFSCPVPPGERATALSIQPRVALDLSWSEEPPECIVGFAEHLAWEQVYTLTSLGEEYVFLVDGPGSRPPTVEYVKLCLDLSAPEPAQYLALEYGGNYDFGDTLWSRAALDVHVSHGETAEIDLGSFLDAFEVSTTGGCLAFEWHEAAVNPAAPAPEPSPAPGSSVVRLHCTLADDIAAAGTVTIRLADTLRDSLENRLAEEFVLVFNNNPLPPEGEPPPGEASAP
ncbi:MAG: Ig-like domain-containing protein [Spirochaetales bacterium]|nr:Ig-like domain-containing protein [Spirochaetales bacterium]